MTERCKECNNVLTIIAKGRLVCRTCNPLKRCEYCNRGTEELRPRHVKQRDGTYTEETWDLCKKCEKHFSTRKPKKVQTNE